MTGSIGMLWAAALAFVIFHLVPASPLRASLIKAMGERAYRGAFSVIAIALLIWMGWAYGAAPVDQVFWVAGAGARYLVLVLVLVAIYLVVAGVSTPNPTAVGAERLMQSDDPARGVLRITRHPTMWGIGLWGIAHIIANGDDASLIFFGAFTVLSLGGTLLIDHRKRAAAPAGWERFSGLTSNLPFAAIAAGRSRLELSEIGLLRPAVALGVFVVLIVAHPWVFNVSPLP